jgi:hypothetical protein
LSFINPNNLKGATKICDVGVANDTCIAREDVLESVKDVLFPAKEVTVIDFSAGEGKQPNGRDEL